MHAIYFLISLTGAFLLFMVQPMAAKSALPVLGGSAFVWNGCMMFFQSLLLAGYFYAYALNRTLAVRHHPWVHVPLLAISLTAFPLTFSAAGVDPALHPQLWLFTMLISSVGLPFFVLSATSPLAQRWFAVALPARNAYSLYAASNLGSFAGLLAYPALIEPLFAIPTQARLLQGGFWLMLLLFATAGWQLRRRTSPQEDTATEPYRLTPRRVAPWIVLSFLPSSLLYGVTSYITTDIAAVPLFWVIPLALYLLSFVWIFSGRDAWLGRWRMLHRLGTPAIVMFAVLPAQTPIYLLGFHLLVFFAAVMVCHSRLSDLKPSPQHLTGFFLWVSLGGVLGGVFNVFIAPAVFNTVMEYPLILALSLVLAHWGLPMRKPQRREWQWLLAVWGSFIGLFWLAGAHTTALIPSLFTDEPEAREWLQLMLIKVGLGILLLAYLKTKRQPLVQTVWVLPALLLMPTLFQHVSGDHAALTARNVFGVSRVMYQPEVQSWVLRHGTTYHGIQSTQASMRFSPTSYYGALADIYAALPKELATQPVAVMGMGIGTVACYGSPNQPYDFFEIDPLVARIAQDARYFSYLADCPPRSTILMGDGRISLARSEDRRYGFIIIDVFSSDAIPIHVLTREAVAMYAQKLQAGGAIAFNISNRHIDLLPVLAAIAQDAGLHGIWKMAPAETPLQFPSQWVVLSADAAWLNSLARNPIWQKLPAADASYLWRDDYSNILRSFKF